MTLLAVVDRLASGNICVSIVVAMLELVSLLFRLIMHGHGTPRRSMLILIAMAKLRTNGISRLNKHP